MLGEKFVIFLDVHAVALSHEVANFINIVLRTRLTLSVFSLLHNLSIIVLNKLCQIVPSRLLFWLPRARLLHGFTECHRLTFVVVMGKQRF